MLIFHSLLNTVSSFTRSAPLSALFALTLIIGLWASSAQATTYYVSTVGSDSNAGTLALPFRTIQKAVSLMRAGDTCLIRGGTYRETVTPASSGTAGAPIIFVAYPNERVIISGANIVSGFTLHQGSIYKAVMPWTMGKGMDQVFANGQVLPEARFPNKASPGITTYPANNLGPLWPALGNFSVPAGTTDRVTSALLNNQTPGLWTGGLYLGLHRQSYQTQTADITNSASGSLTVSPHPGKWYNTEYSWLPEFGRGYISGLLAAMQDDSPGEWVHQHGVLYLWPPQGQAPPNSPTTTIEAKARQLAFNLSEKSHITIRNLEIVGASLNMHGASYCQIDSTKISFVSQYTHPYTSVGASTIPVAQRGEDGIFLGGHHNIVKNSHIANSAGACLFVTGQDHTITNNIIHDCGYSGSWTSSGITIAPDTILEIPTADRGGHEISFNTLYNSGRPQILMLRDVAYMFATGRGAKPPLRFGFPTPFRKIRIVNNELYNANLLMLDSGLFYTNGTDGGGTEIAYNVIHDDLQVGTRGYGVYLDNATWGYDIHHNVLWMGREEGERQAFYANLPGGKIVTSDGPTVGSWDPQQTFVAYNGGDRNFRRNIYKYDYHGGVAGLTDADFPNGQRFAFGASISATTTTTSPP
jgi:hypothetical protein